MRTTITLEPDVAVRLQRLARERGATFKATVNSTLRAGLDAEPQPGRPYQEITRSLGAQRGVDLTKALALAAELEDEESRRKLELPEVIVPDLNLLVYAIDRDAHAHETARRWWEGLLSGTETVGLAWVVWLGFLRITTNPRIVHAPLSADEALDYVDRWLAHPVTVALEPTERHATTLRRLLEPTGTAGNLVIDAHLAALAIEHGARLCSADRDFGRFPGLDWADPLTG